ncbi:hypothetical protein [Streptomyces sp. CC210A]|uniref:hypothetical protein n=1 Tax=Streptomyces sp. CC210A TaxID=2898184 RepID=UPI001F359DBD|nr:hypothetical protein [Streptomyces sp. CC210A]
MPPQSPHPPSPYGGYTTPPPPPPPAPGRGSRRTALIVTAALVAAALAAGGVWFATGDEQDAGRAVATASDSPSAGASSPHTPGGEPSHAPEPSATPSATDPGEPGADPAADPQPTGTTLVGLWRSTSRGGFLVINESEDTDNPTRYSLALVSGGLECKGVRKVEEPGVRYQIALLCSERGGERLPDRDRGGDLVFSGGDMLAVTWHTGKDGTETFERHSDLPAPDDAATP